MRKNLTIQEYHEDPALSKSKLDLIARSIYHYENPVIKERAYFDFGSAMHDACLLPDVFKKGYFRAPEDHDGRNVKGKTLKRECDEKGMVLISSVEYDGILSVRDRLYKNQLTKTILEKSEKEQSFFAKMNVEGKDFEVRCRPDAFYQNTMIDLKTTRSTVHDEIKWSIRRYRYDVQSAWYPDVMELSEGIKIDNFLFIFIESCPPFHVVIKLLDVESTDLGRKKYKADILKLKRYQDNPNDELRIETIGLPSSSFYEDLV